ncbi:MAG: hypothetical protein ACRDLN_02220 [Solirubrobacteraceae bacterium]
MEAVRLLRQLWLNRLLVAVGLGLALLAGTMMTYSVSGSPPKLESRQYVVGVATASVLVDSASSQVADLGGGASASDVGSLTTRARLLANLLGTSPLREQIARNAGIAPETLVAISPEDSVPSGTTVSVGATLDANDRRASVLNLSVRESAPIITVAAQAPSRVTASRLASSTVNRLEQYLGSVASGDQVPNRRRLVVQPLGPAHSATETRGPGRLIAIGVSVMLFLLWCGAILAIQGFARGWRQAAELESVPAGAPATDSEAQRIASVQQHAAEASMAREVLERPERPYVQTHSPSARLAYVEPTGLPDLPERPVAPRQHGAAA